MYIGQASRDSDDSKLDMHFCFINAKDMSE